MERAVTSFRATPGRRPAILKYWHYYLLLTPGMLFFLVFKYLPIAGLVVAFKDYKFVNGIWGSEWVGLMWFEQLFASEGFWIALRNTVIISLYKLAFGFPAPILLALLLNEVRNSVFKRTIQSIVIFPHFMSWVVLGGILFTLLSPSTGILSWFGIASSPLTDPKQFRSLLVFSGIWREAGWNTVIYLAAMAGINPDLYEAAKIDGAGRFRLAWNITLPSIAGTIIILFILRIGYLLQAGFDQVFILYNPLVYNVSDILDTYVYRVGLSMGRISFATAAGFFQSLVGMALLIGANALARRYGDRGFW